MKLLRSMCLTFLFLFGSVMNAFAAEQITSFHSDITIQQDTSIIIQESIHYQTDQEKHGIYRYIPTRYKRSGINYTLRIDQITVTDEKSNDIPFSQSQEKDNVMLKIGDPDTTFSGDKIYVITYTVEQALNQVKYDEGVLTPELYWDITGEGWQFSIASTSAVVHSPYANITKINCYAGAFGSDDQQCRSEIIDHDQAEFVYAVPIGYGDNMTVAVALDPQGQLIFPGQLEILSRKIIDNILFLPLLLPGLYLGRRWWLKGRDKVFVSWNVFNNDQSRAQAVAPIWSNRHVPLVYEPITELTPGEAGAIIDERVDIKDIIAEITDLARQKFLKIERMEKKKLLGKEVDYTFIKLPIPAVTLPEHQQYILDSIFAKKETVKLSELKGKFYTKIGKIKRLMFESLVKKEFFAKNPQETRGWAMGIAVLLSMVAGLIIWALLGRGAYWAIPVGGVSIISSLIFAYYMPAKTAKGHNLMWQARGLQKSIRYGEWREKIKEKHLFFEEVLPFAIALGVVNQLSRDMDKLKVEPPDYMSGNIPGSWTTAHFFNSFASTVSSDLTYNPSSSSSSGSGFSGGSSGGGGGGGGGGSW